MTFLGKTLAVVLSSVVFTSSVPRLVIGQVEPLAPLSAMVAMTHEKNENIAAFVKARVDDYAFDRLDGFPFPLAPAVADTIRVPKGLRSNVVVKWLDPLTAESSAQAPRYGANNDYIAYFGDGWNTDWQGNMPGSAPQFHGSGQAGWIWSNHEFVSNSMPTLMNAPTGQHLTFAKFLQATGVLSHPVDANNGWTQAVVDTYIRYYKQQLGGSWFRVVQEPASGEWRVNRDALNLRYDATSYMLTRVTGHTLHSADHDDEGTLLPAGVAVGILADCSGGQSPWGTIITAEENQQEYYGDLESCWDSEQRFVPGQGCDPGSPLSLVFAASTEADFGRISAANERHNRDAYGYLVEIDPGVAPEQFYTSVDDGGDGSGHRKLGTMGRARWENVTIAVKTDWKLLHDQPIVLYGGDDRRGGRIYKWVSATPYKEGMTRAQIRALLDEGTLYVAHFAGLDNTMGNTLVTGGIPTESEPGTGRWVHLSVTSTDVAPNAETLGEPDKTVGAALQDANWNGIGGFPTNNDVRQALFTASAKIGVMELNRPEDIEWNPRDPSGTPRLYVAFTNHTGGTQLDQGGKLLGPEATNKRNDKDGAIFVVVETDPERPALSKTFAYFQIWKGSSSGESVLEAANPDNLMIDRDGGVWFGTDGNFGRSSGRSADGLYYLDLDISHQQGPLLRRQTYGQAFRILTVPSDAEATGPAFNSDMTTIFLNVQHPGEGSPSTWPQDR